MNLFKNLYRYLSSTRRLEAAGAGVLVLLAVSFCLSLSGATAYGSENSQTSVVGLSDLIAKKDLSEEHEKLLALAASNRKRAKSVDASLDISGNPAIGVKNAAIVLVEFGDFQCPFCRHHLQNAMKHIKAEYVDSGELLYVFYDFSYDEKHPYAFDAARAARCSAEQGKYWEMRSYLYANQKALTPIFLESHAEKIRLDKAQFNLCLSSGKYAQDVSRDYELGKSLGIRGTPTFFLGRVKDNGIDVDLFRRIDGAQPYSVFDREIQALLKSD